MSDKANKRINVRIPKPLQYAGMIWLGFTGANTLLMVLGKM